MILHHAAWSQEPVEHISAEGDGEDGANEEAGLAGGVHSHLEKAIGLAKNGKEQDFTYKQALSSFCMLWVGCNFCLATLLSSSIINLINYKK